MQKIPTVFLRDPEDMSRLTETVNPECQWVIDGEGVATRKYDGTCIMRDETGVWWARREVKPGKTEPDNFQFVNYDENTGKTMGWEPIAQSSFWKQFQNAIEQIAPYEFLSPGTYELCGPKINKNPECFPHHVLLKHSDAEVLTQTVYEPPYTYESLCDWVYFLERFGAEGIVWHHPDGRMAKLKVRDFEE